MVIWYVDNNFQAVNPKLHIEPHPPISYKHRAAVLPKLVKPVKLVTPVYTLQQPSTDMSSCPTGCQCDHIPKANPVIVIHGGAWAIPEHLEVASREGVKRAAKAGWKDCFWSNSRPKKFT